MNKKIIMIIIILISLISISKSADVEVNMKALNTCDKGTYSPEENCLYGCIDGINQEEIFCCPDNSRLGYRNQEFNCEEYTEECYDNIDNDYDKRVDFDDEDCKYIIKSNSVYISQFKNTFLMGFIVILAYLIYLNMKINKTKVKNEK